MIRLPNYNNIVLSSYFLLQETYELLALITSSEIE